MYIKFFLMEFDPIHDDHCDFKFTTPPSSFVSITPQFFL